MKIRVGDLRRLINEALSEDLDLNDPGVWGMKDTTVCRSTLAEFLRKYSGVVEIGPEGGDCTEAEHVMFVDDMEGMGLREAIEDGDVELANAIAEEIALKYPAERYNPFANDGHGTPPEMDGIN